MAFFKYMDLSTEVLPHLAADPSMPLLEASVKAAVIEFCKSSWVWRYFPDAQNLVAGEPTYDLDPAANADVSVVMHCTVDGAPLTNKSTDDLDALLPTWQTDTGTPKYFTQVDNEQIILAPIPDANVAGGIVMTLALQPSQQSINFPKWIHSQYVYDLAAGAIARLMLMPAKTWTDQATGMVYRDKFERAIAEARSKAVHGLSRAVIRTTSHY